MLNAEERLMQPTSSRSPSMQETCLVPQAARNDLAMLEEYKTLRDEIMRRLETRSRLVDITLVATGAVWMASLQSALIAPVLLFYPILVVSLATEGSFQ